MTKVLLSLLLLNLTLLSIHAEEIDFKKIENSYFTECDSNFQYSTLGILRPDQGTIELNTTLNKPFTEFGNDWHFAMKINSTKYFKNGGTSLFGIFIPPLPEKGLVAIIKDGKKRRYLSYKNFSYQPGDKINIALSWGERMKLYVNGKVVAESNYSVRVPDALIPYNFTIERLEPFKVSGIKISSITLPEKDISKDPTVDFTPSENTTFLSTHNLSTHHRFQTPWHKQSGYATIKAASRLEKLCFVEGDTPSFSLLSINYSPAPINYQVELTAKSRPHGKIITKKTTITSNNTGLNELHLIKLPQLKKRGFYDLKVEIYQGKNQSYEFESALAIFPAPDKNLKAGILSNYYGQHYTYGKFDTSVLKQLNIKSIRAWAGASIFRWFNIEPTKGTFHFEKTDEYVKMCKQAGVTEILGLLSNPPRWAAVESDKSIQAQHRLAPKPSRWKPKDLKEWGNYVYKMVDRYKDDIQHWEIYNEVNFHPPAKPASFSGSTQEYFDLLKVAYQQAKKANPNCKILISGFTIHGDKQMPYDLLKMGAADYFDIFNIHGYDGVKTTLPYLEALKKVKPEAPYWMTEQFWLHIENEERRVILTPQIFINFIEQGYQRFFNMGWEEFFSNKYNKSPEIDIYLTSILLNQIRTCDKFIEKVTFSGDESFQIKHSFQRTDGSFLTVLGSGDESFNIEFANAPLSVETAYGEALTSTSNEKHLYANDKVIYVSSKTPLKIINLTSTGKIELMRNGSFDEIEGDLSMGGSQAGKPIGWKYNDKTWSFSFTEDSKDSKYALKIKASKEKRLYILQDTKIFSPGKYTLSCYLKKTGKAKTEATVSISNRSEESRESQTFEIISDSKFERFEVSIDIKEAPAQPLGLVIGIRPGQGGMIVDNIRFEKAARP